ncbi:MAG: TlpA family protein disulfide reductase [Planctomycetota bacterium]
MRIPATTFAFLLALLSRSAGGAELIEERRARLAELFRQAKSAQILKEYSKSNGYLRELLALLPPPEGSRVDPSFARVHYELASNCALLGDKKEALLQLAKAIDRGFWDAEYLARDESLKSLRGDKEFEAELERARRAVGEVAFGLRDISGNELRKEDYAGKVLVLDIWGTWCPPCRRGISDLIALQKKYESRGLAVIGLAWEHQPPDEKIKARVTKFLEERGVNYPNALPPAALIQSVPRLNSFPTTIYVARDGRIAARVAGLEPYEAMERRVSELLAEKPPPKEASR